MCGETLVACSRCLGIYSGFFFSFIFLIFACGLFTRGLNFIYAVLLLVPMAVDGLAQLFRLRESSNPVRFFTGYLAGFSVAMVFYSIISVTINSEVLGKLPDLVSLIPLGFMLIFIPALEKYNNSNNVFLKKFFNFIAISSAIILIAGTLILYGLVLRKLLLTHLGVQ
jgi:uncharacterized membrane protein